MDLRVLDFKLMEWYNMFPGGRFALLIGLFLGLLMMMITVVLYDHVKSSLLARRERNKSARKKENRPEVCSQWRV